MKEFVGSPEYDQQHAMMRNALDAFVAATVDALPEYGEGMTIGWLMAQMDELEIDPDGVATLAAFAIIRLAKEGLSNG